LRAGLASLVSLATLSIACVGSGSSGAPETPKVEDGLYSAQVNEKVAGGKDLIMRFDEVERRGDASVVRVRRESGASVPSAMFIAKGCYEMARRRGAKYFVNLKEWPDAKGDRMYIIAFTSSKNVDLKRLCGPDCENVITDDSFMSVDEFSLLWGESAAERR
jgi:hypothetical protein